MVVSDNTKLCSFSEISTKSDYSYERDALASVNTGYSLGMNPASTV